MGAIDSRPRTRCQSVVSREVRLALSTIQLYLALGVLAAIAVRRT